MQPSEPIYNPHSRPGPSERATAPDIECSKAPRHLLFIKASHVPHPNCTHVLGKKAPQAGFSCLLSTHLRHKARPRKLYKVSQRQKKGSDAKESDVAKIDTPSKNSSH